MKECIRRNAIALLLTAVVVALLVAGNYLAKVVFGTPCDVHSITLSMAFFCMWSIIKKGLDDI